MPESTCNVYSFEAKASNSSCSQGIWCSTGTAIFPAASTRARNENPIEARGARQRGVGDRRSWRSIRMVQGTTQSHLSTDSLEAVYGSRGQHPRVAPMQSYSVAGQGISNISACGGRLAYTLFDPAVFTVGMADHFTMRQRRQRFMELRTRGWSVSRRRPRSRCISVGSDELDTRL
jgi:hypothetical protein